MRHRETARSFHRLAATALLALAGLACGGEESAPTAPEAGSSAPQAADAPAGRTPPPDAPDPAATDPADPEASDPEVVFTDDVVPEGFPGDVPVYPDSVPGASMTVPGLGVFATFTSDDEVSAVLDHYRDQLAEDGWSLEDVGDFGVDATKDGRTVEVRARAGESGETEIAVNVSEG